MVSTRRKSRNKGTAPMPFFEGPSKRYYLTRLNWLLTFLNTEIPELPPGQFLKILNECLLFFYKYPPDPQFKTTSVDTPVNRKALKKIQDVLRQEIDNIRELSYRTLQMGGPSNISNLEINLRYFVEVFGDRLTLQPEIQLRDYRDPRITGGISMDPDTFLQDDLYPNTPGPPVDEEFIEKSILENPRFAEKRLERYVFFANIYDEDIYRSLCLAVVPLLERFPLDRIQKCPECDRYFKVTRKKESDLCARCVRKRATYKWREENPEVYRTYQRSLQKGEKTTPKEIKAKLENKAKEEV